MTCYPAAHYKTVLEAGVSTNDLLLPVILIPVCLLYVIVLCYLESEDVRCVLIFNYNLYIVHFYIYFVHYSCSFLQMFPLKLLITTL